MYRIYFTNSDKRLNAIIAVIPTQKVPVVYRFKLKVALTPVSCVKIQNKLSFRCDTTADPAPMATTNIALPISLSNPRSAIIGDRIEAVVIMATVDEP